MKKLSIALALTMTLLPLAACQGQKTQTTEAPKTPETKQGETKAPEQGKETQKATEKETAPAGEAKLKGKLSIGLPGAYEVTNKDVVDSFIKAHPDLKVEVDSGPWGDYVKKIQTMMASGTAPDTWFQENAVILGNGAKGAALDLAEMVKKDLKADEYSPALFAAKEGDHLWGVPHDVNNIALAYNKDLFDKAGIPYPDDKWTYQDMFDAAKKLTTEGEPGSKTWGYLYQGSITLGWFPFGKVYGGQILNADKTKAVLDDNYWKGIEFAASFVKDGISPDSDLMRELGGPQQIFGNNKAGMMFLTFSTVKPILDAFPNLNWDVTLIPNGFDGKRIDPSVTNSWMIYSRAKKEDQQNAWGFLKYYLSKEAQDTMAKAGTALPVYTTSQQVLLDSIKKPDVKAFTEGLKFAMTLDENPSWNAWRGKVQNPTIDVTDQKQQVTDALKKQTREDTQNAIDTWNADNLTK